MTSKGLSNNYTVNSDAIPVLVVLTVNRYAGNWYASGEKHEERLRINLKLKRSSRFRRVVPGTGILPVSV